jgi:hypothetical protein
LNAASRSHLSPPFLHGGDLTLDCGELFGTLLKVDRHRLVGQLQLSDILRQFLDGSTNGGLQLDFFSSFFLQSKHKHCSSENLGKSMR